MQRPVLVMALSMLLLSAGVIRAQSLCPWLNAATASGALGGEVAMQVNFLSPASNLAAGYRPDAECDFSLTGKPDRITIRVSTMQDRVKEYASAVTACSTQPRSLVGVGNEAVACTRQDRGEVVDEVIGRVRNRMLVLRWTHSPLAHETRFKSEPSDSERNLQMLAEQVTGSMY